MVKKNNSKKERTRLNSNSSLLLGKQELALLSREDLALYKQAESTLKKIKEKYTSKGVFFPVSIINQKLTILESIVKYLKENLNFSLHQIAETLGRDDRNIWNIYNKSKQKQKTKFSITQSKLIIPVSIFSKTSLSALEAVTKYLKEELNLTYHEIALLIKRDDRTIWTVYSRARKKNVKH